MAILQRQIAGPQRMQVDIIVICSVIAVVRHVSGQEGSDLRETELKRLQQAYEEESKQPDRDFQKMDALNRQMGALWPEIQRDKAVHFHVAWKAAADAKKKKRLAEELVAAAVQSDQPDLVVEVASNGSFAEKEIKLPELCQRLPLKALRTFPYSERPDSTSEPEWVVRRM